MAGRKSGLVGSFTLVVSLKVSVARVMLRRVKTLHVHNMQKVVFLLSSLMACRGVAQSNCTSRRCLAEMLIKKGFLSQPQYDNCTHVIDVPIIEYQTLSVDTKKLLLNIRLDAWIEWTDPELEWDTTAYQYEKLVLPVNKIWTPEFYVTNALVTNMKHGSRDLQVSSDGKVQHQISVTAQVSCEVNLFNYPFAFDECPVVFQTWSNNGCGTELNAGQVFLVGGSHGDWQTDSVELLKDGDYNVGNYIWVRLSIKPSNPLITLLLPSGLILLADVGSFALPLTGGERNCFKVTLVLSFTMFLNILSEQLPGDGQCSPIIRIHFCVCLVLLVLSMLVSMMLTRVAHDGSLYMCCCFGGLASKDPKNKKDNEENKPDISVVHLNESEESQTLRKVSKFLDGLDEKEVKNEKQHQFANVLDRVFFWIYALTTVTFFIGMIYVMSKYKCKVNHFDFFRE